MKHTFVSGDSLLFKCLPVAGCISYETFSMNIMNPNHFKEFLGNKYLFLMNGLWFNAHLGFGLYLYHQKHLKLAPAPQRVMYSVFGSCVFNFGSVLLWAVCKSIIPDHPKLRVVVGLATGLMLIYTGRNYLAHINSL